MRRENLTSPKPISKIFQPAWPRLGVIAVVVEDHRVVLVQRALHKPGAGLWGFPGGHVEPGETVKAAAARELFEETSLCARPADTLTYLDLVARDDKEELKYHYVLIAVRCTTPRGAIKAADDASDARWVLVDDVLSGRFPVIKEVGTILREMPGL